VADVGADCVKFQTYRTEEVITDPNEMYEYVSQGRVVQESQLSMFKRLELKRDEFSILFSRAREKGLIPLSTPSGNLAVELLDELDAGAFKVGSDDLVHIPFLEYVASKGKPVIISTGMADKLDIQRAIDAIQSKQNDQICILHCVSLYPAPDTDLNLRKIPALAEQYSHVIGFSDHSNGIIAGLGAVALGASVVEKHFTLDKSMVGPDHHFSADPTELRNMVSGIRRLEEAFGDPTIVPTEDELQMRRVARRSIVAARDLSAGQMISESDLSFQRPGIGLMPYEKDQVIGRKPREDIPENSIIVLNQLQ